MKKNYIKPSSNVYTIEVSALIAESPNQFIPTGNGTSEMGGGSEDPIVGDVRDASTGIWDQEW